MLLGDVNLRARTRSDTAQANNENCDNRIQTPHKPVGSIFPRPFYNSTPVVCQEFAAAQSRRKSNGVVISHRHTGRLVAELPASATYTRSIFTFTLMAKYRLLLACAAAFISTFALGAEPAVQHAAPAAREKSSPS